MAGAADDFSADDHLFHAKRAAAVGSALAEEVVSGTLFNVELALVSPAILAAEEVLALKGDASARQSLYATGFDGAIDAEGTVAFARSGSFQIQASAEFRNRTNFRIGDAEAGQLGVAGNKAKIESNLAAVGLLKKLEAEKRRPTEVEQAELARYVDFGGLRKIWDQPGLHAAENLRMAELLSQAEIEAIKATSINTHYTSMAVVDRVWEAVEALGFDGGTVLEPGMGVGNFFGRMPERLAAVSDLFGVEKNPVSGRMARQLYPEARILIKPFEEVLIPNNTVDLVIGNPPFAEIKIFDPAYTQPKLSTHNYFIVKSLDKLKPGGVAALITSHYTLDSGSEASRLEMAKRADLIGAVRLPRSAFERNAGTTVTTDILFFRKRAEGERARGDLGWTKTTEIDIEGGRSAPINEYFAAHPEMVLGRHALTRGQYQDDEYTVLPTGELSRQLEDAIERLPKNRITPPSQVSIERPTMGEAPAPAPFHIKNGAFFIDKGEVWVNVKGERQPLPEGTSRATVLQLKALVGIRDALLESIRIQKDGGSDEELAAAQVVLSSRYDAYRAAYGPLMGPKTLRVFRNDPEYPLLTALESFDPESELVSKADIFTKRTVRPYAPLRELPSDPQAAMLKVLAETGKLDTALMASLLGREEQEVTAALVEADLIYRDPVSGTHTTAEEYLSGRVRVKLEQAKAAAEIDPAFERNVAALQQVQPEPLTMVDIDARLGQTWIPAQIYARFVHEQMAGQSPARKPGEMPAVSRDTGGRWFVQLPRTYNEFALEHDWAGGTVSGHKLLEFGLNQSQPTVYFPADEDGKRSVDTANTVAARVKLQEVKDAFRTWVKGDAMSKQHPELERLYNDAHNGVRQRVYSGKHLAFPGLSMEKQPRDYQASSVWRIVQEGRALIDHFVGAGKTLTMIAAGMELRRTGLSNKNLYVVPNNMVPQWREDFKSAYPTARVLAVTDADLVSAKNRQQLFSRIATNEWDAVIVPHSQFNMLPISPERERITVERQIAELREILYDRNAAAKTGEVQDKRSERQVQVAVQKLEQRLKELTAGRKDKAIYFDDLGVDQMFVDEAHFFKALPLATKMGNVAGLSTRQSQRAQNMLAKIEYLYDTHNNRGVVFATGTAITNTLGEAYTMARYLAPDVLERSGIKHFDDWAANFAETTTKLEYAVDGATIRPKTSLSTFVNVPELRQLWAQFADVVTQDEAVAAGYIKVPYAVRKDELVEVTPEQEPMLREIAERGERLLLPRGGGQPDPTEDNWLKLDADARDISLDARMRDSSAEDHPGSKANAVVRIAKDVYDRTGAERGTVLIFADRYATSDGRFNLFEDIRAKLVAKGVPAAEVAVVHDFANRKQFSAMQNAMRAGRIRILLGTTEKLGVGLNVQTRLKAEIHVDLPQRPDQVEQREGRIVRFGNTYDQVEIYRLITKPRDVNAPKAHDLQRAQLLERKQTFLTQFKQGGQLGRHLEDIAGDVRLSPEIFALAKAQATGNPLALEKVKLENEIKQIALLDRAHQLTRHRNKQELDQRGFDLDFFKGRIPLVEGAIETMKQHEVRDGDGKLVRMRLVFNGQVFETPKDAAAFLKGAGKLSDQTELEVNGVKIEVSVESSERMDLNSGRLFTSTRVSYRLAGDWHEAPKGDTGTATAHSLVTSALIRSRDLKERLGKLQSDLRQCEESVERLQVELAKPSAYGETLRSLHTRLDEVQAELLKEVKPENDLAASVEPESVMDLAKDTGSELSFDEGAVVIVFERHADALAAKYGGGVEPAAADALVAGKLADEGWAANAIAYAVRVAGMSRDALSGKPLEEYAAAVAEKAASRVEKGGQVEKRSRAGGMER